MSESLGSSLCSICKNICLTSLWLKLLWVGPAAMSDSSAQSSTPCSSVQPQTPSSAAPAPSSPEAATLSSVAESAATPVAESVAASSPAPVSPMPSSVASGTPLRDESPPAAPPRDGSPPAKPPRDGSPPAAPPRDGSPPAAPPSPSEAEAVAFESGNFGMLEEHVKAHSFPMHVRTCGPCKFWKIGGSGPCMHPSPIRSQARRRHG